MVEQSIFHLIGHQTSVRFCHFKESKQDELPKRPKHGQNSFNLEKARRLRICNFSLKHRNSYFHHSLGKFGPILKDVATLTCLPMFGEMQSTLFSTRQTRRSWNPWIMITQDRIRRIKRIGFIVEIFQESKRENNEFEFEAMLAYWLSWYVLSSDPTDLNSYVYPLAVLLAKGEKLALAPVYLWSLFFRLDVCIKNIIRSIEC